MNLLPYLTLYKDGESRRVFLVDSDVFIAHGWSVDQHPVSLPPEQLETPLESAYDLRKAELEALLKQGWQKIAAVAKPLGLDKPEDGWDEAIPMILDAEGLSE